MFPYLAGAAVVAAVLIAAGAPFASLLPFAIVLACPLMMIVMMPSMSRQDHTGDAGDHNSTRTSDPPATRLP